MTCLKQAGFAFVKSAFLKHLFAQTVNKNS